MPSERRGSDRRVRDRRARLTALQTIQDDLRATIEQNAIEIERLKDEQRLQLIRIAQIQHELDLLKKSRR